MAWALLQRVFTLERYTMMHPLYKNCFVFSVALLMMHAHAARADVFRIEIDYMGASGTGHNHRPDQIVLDAVIQMFECHGRPEANARRRLDRLVSTWN